MKQGFSLLELSIVLVIIGLIAGGIVAGSSMIRAAELRAVITEQQQYKIALNTFKDKYFGLPGDLKNATAFWGVAAGTGDDLACRQFASTDSATCNGNGDGLIWQNGSGISVEYGRSEILRTWQHLANAGLINGTYTGTYGAAGTADHQVGVNHPESKITGAGWTLWHIQNGGWNSYGKAEHSLWFGADTSSGSAYSISPVLTAKEAWSMDKKMDDGKPGTGKVYSRESGGAACTSTDLAATAEYLVANDAIECMIIFSVE